MLENSEMKMNEAFDAVNHSLLLKKLSVMG